MAAPAPTEQREGGRERSAWRPRAGRGRLPSAGCPLQQLHWQTVPASDTDTAVTFPQGAWLVHTHGRDVYLLSHPQCSAGAVYAASWSLCFCRLA